MTITYLICRTTLWMCAILLMLVSVAFAQDEPQSFNAFAVVQGKGSVARSGEMRGTMAATFEGAFFVDVGEGPVHAGRVLCPASAHIELDTTKQSASGACTFNALDGAVAWGEWECTGFNMVGCHGTFKLTGGTGRFAGATGEASLIWRPTSAELKKQLEGAVLNDLSGILIWRDFKVKAK